MLKNILMHVVWIKIIGSYRLLDVIDLDFQWSTTYNITMIYTGGEKMNPIALTILGLDIRWYGILISVGILIGVMVAKYTSGFRDLNLEIVLDMLLIALPLGIVGARVYYVVFNFNEYSKNLIDVFNIRQGGLAIHGGLIFAFLSALVYCKWKKVNFLSLGDVTAPSIIIAQAIGRWGNFFNQEAHGGIVSFSFIKHFPKFIQRGMLIDGNYYNPTFLYESLWNLCVFLILIIILRKSKRLGIVLFSYIGLYSMGRLFIEGLRTDSLMLGPFRIAQIMSLLGIILAVLFVLYSYFSTKENKEV
jgi:phosphatidylglycerol---prolipoprotein diacylglyceryl transferase